MRHPVTAIGILALGPLLLAACVTPPTYPIGPAAEPRVPVSGTAIAIVDKRPASDRESSIGSLLITSSRYGIHTLGDERFVPPPLSALSQRLQRATATWPAPPQSITLTVSRFNTENNVQAAMRHSAMGSTGLTELGMAIGEAILGKMREQNIDLRKPFVVSLIEADADIRWPGGRGETRRLSVVKAQNYNEGTSQEKMGQIIAATVSAALDAASAALVK
jgi:hypothetical protein